VDLYNYALVRCVPEPRTGEFINIGAIAGSGDRADWEVRQIENERRAARLCSSEHLASVHRFLGSVAERIEQAEEDFEPLPSDWLFTLHGDLRNVVQLSQPLPAVGDTAADVLDTVFERMLIDPERASRGFVGKATLLASLRKVFQAHLGAATFMERPEVFVGNHLRSHLDFAVGRDATVQITQAWSFQKGTIDDVATEVKSWGFALERLRSGEAARIVSRDGSEVRKIESDVEIDVLFAAPQTARQHEVFEEAREVFSSVGATAYSNTDAEDLGKHARDLVDA
jgi:hypothetical protein